MTRDEQQDDKMFIPDSELILEPDLAARAWPAVAQLD